MIVTKNMTQTAAHRLQKKRQDLIDEFLAGKGNAFQRRYTAVLDEYFIESFADSMVGPRMDIAKKPYAIIALGGYGRQEQCVHSDVDLLFLFKKAVPEEAEALIREIIYPLWDLGLIVGHTTLSMKEGIQLAAGDLEVFTAMLDARFICGMSPLYTEMQDRLQNRVIRGKSKKFITWLVERNQERHDRFGDSSYLLEPNLKEGQGGLRDYHTMLWVSRVKSRAMEPRDLEYYGYLSHEEYRRFRKSLAFIWQVRNHLHHLAGRKSDQLHFEFQHKLANLLRFRDSAGHLAVEKFLGKLHGEMEYIKQHNLMLLAELGYVGPSRWGRRRPEKETQVKGLEVQRNMLNFISLEKLLASPDLLLKIFQESARLKIPLSSESRRVVKEFGYLIDAQFRKSPENVAAFEQILITPAATFNVLNTMLNTGILARFIPEMKEISDRIQFDQYHLYPVDRHSLRAVRILKSFGTGEHGGTDGLYHNLYREVGAQKKLLLLSALLHDIGKGAKNEEDTRGHADIGAEIAKKILKRMGYAPEQIETVSFLIRQHLFLIETATRRDIQDEETAVACAREINDIKRLKMLYLLTVADSMATGPKAWNDWTAALLRDFFFKVLNILERGELATREATAAVEQKKERILSTAESETEGETLKKHLEILPPRYLLYTPIEDIRHHYQLYQDMGDNPSAWNISRTNGPETRTVTICAKDRPGLFSKIAGVFTLNNVDILNAQIYTWRNQIALDIFVVKPPPDPLFEDERWAKAAGNLTSALNGDLDIAAALKEKSDSIQQEPTVIGSRPSRVVIDNDSSSFFTIIEVFTHDSLGLLFQITNALFQQGLDVVIAKIATKVDQVVDVFYVRDIQGEKVDDPQHTAEIEAAIEAVISPPIKPIHIEMDVNTKEDRK